jgi:hypothetical protein
MEYRVFYPVVALLCVAATVLGRTSQPVDVNSPQVVTLALQPAHLDTGQKYSLIPSATALKDGDGAAFYRKAVEALPKDLDVNQVWNYLRVPIGELPKAEAEALVKQGKAPLQLVGQGTQCRKYNWPAFHLTKLTPNLPQYRQLAGLLCLQARLEITKGQYDDAVQSIGTVVTTAARVGDAPAVTQSLLGIGIAGMALRRVIELSQAPGSPNLYTALKGLPSPLIDVEKPIANEKKNLTVRALNALSGGAGLRELEPAYDRTRQLMHRLDADVASLVCIEALRHYAATHGKKLPAKLSDIADVQLPNDPMTGEPFSYRIEASKATLEVSAPKGGRPRDGVRYEITIAP